MGVLGMAGNKLPMAPTTITPSAMKSPKICSAVIPQYSLLMPILQCICFRFYGAKSKFHWFDIKETITDLLLAQCVWVAILVLFWIYPTTIAIQSQV